MSTNACEYLKLSDISGAGSRTFSLGEKGGVESVLEWGVRMAWSGFWQGREGKELLTNPVPDPLSKGSQQHRATDICAPVLKMRKLSLRRDT